MLISDYSGVERCGLIQKGLKIVTVEEDNTEPARGAVGSNEEWRGEGNRMSC